MFERRATRRGAPHGAYSGRVTIPVPLEDLAEALTDRPWAYLMTVSDDARVHVVAVVPELTASGLRVAEPGRRTRANADARPDVTLAYPPTEPDGFTLVVDGTAAADEDGPLVVRPSSAVLHRPAPVASQDSSSRSSRRPVT